MLSRPGPANESEPIPPVRCGLTVALAARRVLSAVGATVAAMSESVGLPRAREATIPTAKLVSYALDHSHERGRHKARVFASALGITSSEWRYLHDQILAKLPDGEVRSTRITAFGIAYEVIVMIDGLNGRTAAVVTTWIVANNAAPRLTSTWVDIP